MGSVLFFEIVAAAWLTVVFWKKLKKNNWATPVSIGFGIAIFAAILGLDAAASIKVEKIERQAKLEDDKNKEDAARTKEAEKLIPQYLAGRIREWLDKANYPTQLQKPMENESFRLTTVDNSVVYVITQPNDIAGIIRIDASMQPDEKTEKRMIALSPSERLRLTSILSLELLRLGTQDAIMLGDAPGYNAIHLREEFPFDPTANRMEFLMKFFAVKRARRLLEHLTSNFLDHPNEAKPITS